MIPPHRGPSASLQHVQRLLLCTAVCLALSLLGCSAAGAVQRFVDFLYVEANEGSSSGGHSALGLGRETFHFQHEQPGIIRIRRLDSSAFRHMYGRLGNRGIRASRVAVSNETYDLLQDSLTELLLIQDAQLAVRDALRRDAEFFEQLQARQSAARGSYQRDVAGLGYFRRDLTGGGPAPALAALRERLAMAGADSIERRRTELRGQLDLLPLRAADVPQISRDRYPSAIATVSSAYDELIAALAALETLQTASGLIPGTYWHPAGDDFMLTAAEQEQLARYCEQLERELCVLFSSARSDWGQALLTGMARLAVLRESVSSGRLVLLDLYAAGDDGRGATDPAPRLPAAERLELQLERRQAFRHWRREFFSKRAMNEADYARLERAANLLLEFEQAEEAGRPLRDLPESPFPSRRAFVSGLPQPAIEAARLQQELTAARSAAAVYEAALARLYAYRLVNRNCVTELFAELNRAIGRRISQGLAEESTAAERAERLRRESERLLGGFIDAGQGFNFVPFVAANAVDAAYAVSERRDYPSYRRERLADMYRSESPLLVFLRECNTITSTIYRPSREDSSFLFFTDNALLLRPLFGGFNLAAGVGDSLLGLALLPLSGPERLVSGARGAFFSLPELFFFNIRKGSLEYVRQAGE